MQSTAIQKKKNLSLLFFPFFFRFEQNSLQSRRSLCFARINEINGGNFLENILGVTRETTRYGARVHASEHQKRFARLN